MLIFLIGYMGCGKSTIGRKLKALLDWDLVDTDALIEHKLDMSVGEIFDKHGEDYFRQQEREVLQDLIDGDRDCIVSTGGGLPLWGDNMDVMNSAGETIYIRRTAENIASRLSPHGRAKRPKLRGLNDDELIAFMDSNITLREPIYLRSKYTIEAVPLSDTQILNQIITHVGHDSDS